MGRTGLDWAQQRLNGWDRCGRDRTEVGARGQDPGKWAQKSSEEARGQVEAQSRYAFVASERTVQPAERMGVWLPSGHIVPECASQPAVSAHRGFRRTPQRVFVEAYAHISGYGTRPRLRLRLRLRLRGGNHQKDCTLEKCPRDCDLCHQAQDAAN